MTEHAPPGDGAPAQAGVRSRRACRLRERSLMRNPLPAIAAAITAFLVVLTLMVARLATGGDPALHMLTSTPTTIAATAGHGRTVLRTTASGRTVLTTAGASGQANAVAGASASALVTRASGTGRRDD